MGFLKNLILVGFLHEMFLYLLSDVRGIHFSCIRSLKITEAHTASVLYTEWLFNKAWLRLRSFFIVSFFIWRRESWVIRIVRNRSLSTTFINKLFFFHHFNHIFMKRLLFLILLILLLDEFLKLFWRQKRVLLNICIKLLNWTFSFFFLGLKDKI